VREPARIIPPDLIARLWQKDDSLWPAGEDVPSKRLGWLTLPIDMRAHIGELERFRDEVLSEGFETVALLGMGGSSLAPELFASLLAVPGHPELLVFDSIHPDQVRSQTDQLDLEKTLFCVASKSGTTAETDALYRHFFDRVPRGPQFAAITDPGTPLAGLAEERGFRATFYNPPDVGGRFSALSLFGLVPAAMVGADPEGLLESAAEEAARSKSPQAPAARLGLTLARAVAEGRDKLTLTTSPSLAPFADWAEQLLAESTGKHGTGIVPIVGEPPLSRYGIDREFVSITLAGDEPPPKTPIQRELTGAYDLGAELFFWELATAVAGVGLGINPFDQPDVEAAKRAARSALASRSSSKWEEMDPEILFHDLEPPAYGAILAFAPRDASNRQVLQRARLKIASERGAACVAAFGPRYLHSAGQLYKGGPRSLRAMVVLAEPEADMPIPGLEHTFGRLVAAQALGDVVAMREAGQRVATTTWGRLADWVG